MPEHDDAPTALSAAMEENLGSYISYCSGLPEARLQHFSSHSMALSGVTQATLNAVLHVRFNNEQVEEQVENALAPFKLRELPMLWWLFPGTQPRDLGPVLIRHGMHYAGQTPGMALELSELSTAQRERRFSRYDQLHVEEVRDALTLDEWIMTVEQAYSDGPEYFDPVYCAFEQRLGYQSGRPYRRFLARSTGHAVAAAAIFITDSTIGLYSVGTIPQRRGEGIASALLTAILQEVRREYRYCVLQTSEQGRELYARLGFRTCCLIDNYSWHPA